MAGEWLIANDLEGNCRGLILIVYPGIRLEELGKTTKNLSQDGVSPGRDLNPGSTEYEAGALTAWPRCSVCTLMLLTPKHKWK
jgi:hypothetical protein